MRYEAKGVLGRGEHAGFRGPKALVSHRGLARRNAEVQGGGDEESLLYLWLAFKLSACEVEGR